MLDRTAERMGGDKPLGHVFVDSQNLRRNPLKGFIMSIPSQKNVLGKPKLSRHMHRA
jgi:hypothetical protein